MKIYVQKLFQPFYELPANLPSSYLRSYVFTNYAFLLCGILHFTGIFIFSFVGVKILALYNIASVVIWAFAIFFNFKGYIKTSFALAQIEIMYHPNWALAFDQSVKRRSNAGAFLSFGRCDQAHGILTRDRDELRIK